MLHSLIQKICACLPSWYSVTGHEASDTSYREQLNISIRWVDEAYEIYEDPVGIFNLPNTTSETLFTIVKDLLIHSLSHSHFVEARLLIGQQISFELNLASSLGIWSLVHLKPYRRVSKEKNTSVQEEVTAINLAKSFYKNDIAQMSGWSLLHCSYQRNSILNIRSPQLPHSIEALWWQSATLLWEPQRIYLHQYFETFDWLLRELKDRFNQTDFLTRVLALESLLMNESNGKI